MDKNFRQCELTDGEIKTMLAMAAGIEADQISNWYLAIHFHDELGRCNSMQLHDQSPTFFGDV